MVLPYTWPEDEYPDDLPEGLPSIVEEKAVDVVQKVSVDSVHIDAVDYDTDEETWVVTFWVDSPSSERVERDISKTIENVANHPMEERGFGGDSMHVRFEYSP